ncbi:MAG: Fe-S cluster assembly scaffold protein NifU [Anaerolineales bacterium]|nr:MAG: Fe-S cluster assembly scaffold protein NifU [Anaerolineales bacterium]
MKVQYSEKVMDHFMNPRNMGEIEDADGVGTAGNPVCGDTMVITLKIEEGRIVDVKFKTFGCGAAIATSSMVTELVKGKAIEEALQVTNNTVAEALDGLPPIKMHCSVLAEEGIRAAIEDYLNRNGHKADM